MSYWARKECLIVGTISLKCRAVHEKRSGFERNTFKMDKKTKCKGEDSHLKSLWGLKANMTYLRSGESLNLWEKIFAINE